MTKPKPKPLGTAIDVPEGATITRPDRSEITVSGGVYVLDVPGFHTIDGNELEAADVGAEETSAP